MKALSILSLAFVVMLGACGDKDDDPSFVSAVGDWTYTTPDGKITVNFTITEVNEDGSNWSYESESTMVVDGVTGKSAVDMNGFHLNKIDFIHINANDVSLTYVYPVNFLNATVSADFKEIKVPGATYTWPKDKTNQLTDITITRK